MSDKGRPEKDNEIDSLDAEIKELKKKRKVLANNTPKEGVDGRKFTHGMLNFWNPVMWLKDIHSVLNIRKLILFGIILLFVYFKGQGSQPVLVNTNDFVSEFTIEEGINKGDTLRLEANRGRLYYQLVTKDGWEGRRHVVRRKDIPNLKPYGISLKPKFFAGYGTEGGAVGGGFELAHFWRFNLDAFLMSDKVFYVGVSYDLEMKHQFLENSALGIALGKSLENVEGSHIIVYWTIKF